jgi:WD40 repeat protein
MLRLVGTLVLVPMQLQATPGDLLVVGLTTHNMLRYDGQTGDPIGSFLEFVPGDLPLSMTFGPDGSLYVADRSNGWVRRYDGQTGLFLAYIVLPGILHGPSDLTFGPDGNLYIACFDDESIVRCGPTGLPLGPFIPGGSTPLVRPRGLGFGADGDLFVTSDAVGASDVRVLRYDGRSGVYEGVFVPFLGHGPTQGLRFGPNGGDLYLLSGSAVHRYDRTTGAHRGVFASGGGLFAPLDLVFGPDGNLYVSSSTTDEVLCYDGTTGTFLRPFVVANGSLLDHPAAIGFIPFVNAAPVCDAGGLYGTPCVGAQTLVQLEGRGSSDPNGDPLSYSWSSDCPGASFDDPASPTPILAVDATCGCRILCNVDLAVTDGLATSSCAAQVFIADVEPPVLVPHTFDVVLWPPDSRYVPVPVGDCLQSAGDRCDPTVRLATLDIVSVASDEPEDTNGPEDGSTLEDIVIACPNTVWLRAERGVGGDGRVYTIKYHARDAAGNETEIACQVQVPRDETLPALPGPGPGHIVTQCGPPPEPPRPPSRQPMLVQQAGRSIETRFEMEDAGRVRLGLYDVHGRRVCEIERMFAPGSQLLSWPGVDGSGQALASGVYLLKLDTPSRTHRAKFVWVR